MSDPHAGTILPEEVPGRALVVTAHPDDVDFGAAGTVAQWVKAGAEVSYCIVTNGDAGGFDPSVPRDAIPAIRQAEQRAAAAELGVSDVRFLGYPDGRLVVSLELRRDIARVIRELRPTVVLTQSPMRTMRGIGQSHPDHLATGEATLCAVYPDARNPFTFTELAEEGLEAHKVSRVWIIGGPDANRTVDVTDTFPLKLAALRAHASQIVDPSLIEERVRTRLSAVALAGGLPEGHLAEAFQVVETA